MSVSEWNNHESTISFPSVHVVVESGTPDETDIQWPDPESNTQMREADPTILKWTDGRYAVEALVAGESILVRLPGELIGMDANVEPMGDVECHEGARKVLVRIDDLVFELSVRPHCKEVKAICDMVDGMQDGLNSREEGQPDQHILWELHV